MQEELIKYLSRDAYVYDEHLSLKVAVYQLAHTLVSGNRSQVVYIS